MRGTGGCVGPGMRGTAPVPPPARPAGIVPAAAASALPGRAAVCQGAALAGDGAGARPAGSRSPPPALLEAEPGRPQLPGQRVGERSQP